MEKYYTCEEISQLYDVKIITVWDWVRKGILPAIKVGKSYRIRPQDLSVFEEEHKTKTN